MKTVDAQAVVSLTSLALLNEIGVRVLKSVVGEELSSMAGNEVLDGRTLPDFVAVEMQRQLTAKTGA